MKKIRLTQGKYALVDEEDFEYLSKFKWWYTTRGYAVREEKKKVIFMHRIINKTPKSMDTDHINRNKLDNTKENLRTVTRQQNLRNVGLQKNNTSGMVGVQKAKNSWMARIKVNYKTIYLGCFLNKVEAIEARKKAEVKYYALCK